MTFERLTQREVEVLVLMNQGLTNRQIAGRLTLEQSTVRWYARQIYAKLGAEDRRHAIHRAIEIGLLPGAEPPPQPRNNLPSATTAFVGRESELAQLAGMLGDPAVRLITIVGPGGIGKTRLSLAAAEAQLAPHANPAGAFAYLFSDGVWFVPLAAVSRPELLAGAIAAALGLQLEGQIKEEPLGQLLRYLRHKRLLLVLDNFEQLAEAAALLTGLMTAGEGVKLLVTSRERLEIQGEQVFSIEGLAVPQESDRHISKLDGFAAVQLFLNTARRVQPGLELSEGDEPHLLRICRAVDGSPLAIELAASWVSVMPLGSIADEIEGNLSALAAGMRDMPARHRSIRAALEASWQRLAPEQRTAFMRLSIFSGGFTRQAAYQVAGATMPLMVQLVYKSWLIYDWKTDRYRIHELLRQYGFQRLAAGEMEAITRDGHTAYFMSFLKEREADFHHSRQVEVVQEIQTEAENIWRAWEWAVVQRDVAQMDRGMNALCRFLAWVGRIRDAELACRAAAEGLADLNKEQEPTLLALQVKTLLWQITFTRNVETKGKLLGECQMLIDRAAEPGMDMRGEQAGLHLRLAYEEADVSVALQHFEMAFALFRSLDDGPGMSKAKIDEAYALMRLSRLDEAEAAATESLTIRRQMGDRLGTADSQTMLALVYKHKEQPEVAESLQREAMQLYQTFHYPLREMSVAGDLANTLWWLGRFEEMLQMVEHAIAMQDDLGIDPDPYFAITAAWALLHLGRYLESRRMVDQALVDARITGSPFTPYGLMILGQLAAVIGPTSFDAEQFQEGSASMMVLWPNEAAQYLAVRTYLSIQESDRPRAVSELLEALRWAFQHQSYDSGQYCLPAAALLTAPGDPERAVELHALSRTFVHIANSRWFADVAGRQLDDVAAGLPPEVAEAARVRGRGLDIWATVRELSADMKEV